MNNNDSTPSTRELWMRLFQSDSLDSFFKENDPYLEFPSFSDYLNELCRIRNVKPAAVIKSADLESSFGHRLFSGERNPSRDTVIKLAFGFGLSIDETQQFLKVARAAQLHPKVHRDAIIAFCIHNGRSLLDTQDILFENKLPLIGDIRL